MKYWEIIADKLSAAGEVDGRDSREYLAHLHELEDEAKAAKRS
jgi:hypothetical protein